MIQKGIALGGAALGGLTSGLTGWFVSPEVSVDETSDYLINSERYPKVGRKLKKVSGYEKIKVPDNAEQSNKRAHHEIDKHYFGHWRNLSEGGKDPLYLVTVDGKFINIPYDKHSSGRKNYWKGRQISDIKTWFGPRQFVFDKPIDPKDPVDGLWDLYFQKLSKLQETELQKLSAHVNKYSDEEWCEIWDVLWNCNDVKNKVIPSGKKIREGITFKFETILKLTEHNKIREIWPHLSKVVDEMIKVSKFSSLQKHISSSGVQWLRERYENTDSDKVTPVRLVKELWSAEEIGYDCKNGDTQWKKYFEECNHTPAENKPQVVRVLKATADYYQSKYVVPTKGQSGAWWGQKDFEQADRSLLKTDIERTGKYKGFIGERCPQYWTSMFFVNIPSPESEFCKEIMEELFEAHVANKRLCLYEIPGARGYLRAYRFKIFTFTEWKKGNKFWAKCDADNN